jgi:hypothetical protein
VPKPPRPDEEKPGPDSLRTGKITGDFQKYSGEMFIADICIFIPVSIDVPVLDVYLKAK